MNANPDFLMNSTGAPSLWQGKSNLNTLLGKTSQKSKNDFDYRDLLQNMNKIAPGGKANQDKKKNIIDDFTAVDDDYNATPFVNASPATKRKNFSVNAAPKSDMKSELKGGEFSSRT